MGRRILRYMVCDICRAEKVEESIDSKGNNSKHNTGITNWELPVLINKSEGTIGKASIDICESCLNKVANIERDVFEGVANYKFRNEG